MTIQEQIDELRRNQGYGGSETAADTMEALVEVALHAKRRLDDPSWGQHKINLKKALAKLEHLNDHKEGSDE